MGWPLVVENEYLKCYINHTSQYIFAKFSGYCFYMNPNIFCMNPNPEIFLVYI